MVGNQNRAPSIQPKAVEGGDELWELGRVGIKVLKLKRLALSANQTLVCFVPQLKVKEKVGRR